ncbi:hydroxyproline-rich glycoprotein family protein [Forsythia ovata]|uniref:Hydroxyproline-rich glycoprotein family protein n=1 Tax=Forsythia ovata TaxID=205694 RepID=A0ABD1UVZ3_9LAMI
MKSWGKLRSFALHKSESKDNWDHQISANKNGLAQATKDMKDMRTCYDSLLSAAAATTNSAYEFSESLLEMGNCLLEKTALDDGGESGRALLMLGRVQLELHKLVDSYRSHIMLTITNPSESLLTELRKVEEMKLQCDEKREMLEHMVTQYREKGRSRLGKGENFPSQQLQAVREEYDEAARLCVFRVESLKQGQCRSLLTQAARHHTAQINFFRKALLSLESIEQHIQVVAEKQHIDCQPYGLDDGEDGDNERNSFKTNYDGKLSFNYTQNKQEIDNVFTLGNSTEINLVKRRGERITSRQSQAGSHSAPIFEEKFDPSERIGETQTSIQKQNTHVLPTPADARSSSSGTSSSTILSMVDPLAILNYLNKRLDYFSVYPLRQQPSSLNVPSSASPPLISSPKISELHELPKPPDSLVPKPSGVPGYSAPLVSRNRAVSPTNRNPLLASKVASPLPPPPQYFSRSLSIPAGSQSEIPLHGGKLLESSEIKDETGTVCSPPLTPISLSNMPSSESGEIRGKFNILSLIS